MDVQLTQDSLQYRIIGGVPDLYILAGPTPADVLDQMTRIVGRPMVPPFWSLGFHNCKCEPLQLYSIASHQSSCKGGNKLKIQSHALQAKVAGPTPPEVLDQTTRIAERPTVPPFWSLGFHNCKCEPLKTCFNLHDQRLADMLAQMLRSMRRP